MPLWRNESKATKACTLSGQILCRQCHSLFGKKSRKKAEFCKWQGAWLAKLENINVSAQKKYKKMLKPRGWTRFWYILFEWEAFVSTVNIRGGHSPLYTVPPLLPKGRLGAKKVGCEQGEGSGWVIAHSK